MYPVKTECEIPSDEKLLEYKSFVYKIPVIAWVITTHSRHDGKRFIMCNSVCVNGSEPDGEIDCGFQDLHRTDNIVGIVPAMAGTYRIMGAKEDGDPEELIGHIIPG